MLKCSAVTTKGTACAHSVRSGATYQGPDGWTYFLCGQHFDMIQRDVHSVTLEKNPARGHKADQPQLDINTNPIATAWVNKEAPTVLPNMQGNINGQPDRGQCDPEVEAIIAEQQNAPLYVMVTGHRAKEFNDTETANTIPLLTRVLTKLQENRNVVAISGGADGADRMFARAAHNLGIPFDLYLPHPGYYSHYHRNAPWTIKIQEAASQVVFSKEKGPFHYSMNFVRNHDMINAAEVHVVVSNKSIADLLKAERGGTSHAVKTMRALGVERVIHVNPRNNTVVWVKLNG